MKSIYICNTCDDCIKKIDVENLDIDSIKLKSNGRPIGPRSISVKNELGVVANSYDNSLSFLDLINLKEIEKVYIGPHPKDVKLYKEYACVACSEINSIIFCNMKNKNIEFEIPSGNAPNSMALDFNRGMLLSTNLLENTVSFINLQSKTLDNKINVGEYPIKIIMSKNNDYFYLCESYLGGDNGGVIGIYSMKSLECVNRIKVGSMPIDIFEDEKNQRLYVANFGKKSISIVDIKKGEVIKDIIVDGMPNGIIKIQKEIFVTDYLYGKLNVISEENGKRKIIAIGCEPSAMIMINSNHQKVK